MQSISVLKLLLLSCVALQNAHVGTGARILAAFFFPGRSHFMMTNAIIRELVKRGNEVTFITPFSLAKENLGSNYIEVLIPQYDFWPEIKEKSKKETILEMTDLPTLTFIHLVQDMGTHSTDFAFEQPEIQAFIHAKEKIGKYDLLLAEQFFNEGALILGHLYQIPIITISTFGYASYFSSMTGLISPWSYVPHSYMPYTDRMTFVERFGNVLISGLDDLLRKFVYLPAQNAILRKHFAHLLDEVPTIRQLERNISALLLNSYVPIEVPKPTSFNMIPVGGLHILPPKPLPQHLQNFLDEAKHGAIYFSLGSQVRSADLPPEKLKIFLNVFSSLKQRVLWKFEDDKLKNLPANVMVQKWMPQNDILPHPNVQLFIAHGGLFGTQEAAHYGVPVLGIPIYSDQYLNIKRGEAMGYALSLDYRTITEENLKWSLNELLNNPKYQTNMQRVSRVFRDRPLGAMDTAMYWIDYVIEHRGAPHLVSASLDLSWYQFYLLDIFAVAVAIVVLPLLALYLICCKSSRKTIQKVKKN